MLSLQAHIASLQLRRRHLLTELEQNDAELLSAHAQYNSLRNEQSAVNKIPPELLSNIFLLCQSLGPPRSYYSFAAAASHICRHWRAVALSTSLLWNDIHIRLRSSSSLVRLQAHLDRSGSCFLDIWLDTVNPNVTLIMEMLMPHCARWRRFTLMTLHGNVGEFQTFLHEAPTPMLEHLALVVGVHTDISFSSRRTSFPSDIPKILTMGAPLLKFIRLGGMALGNLHPPLEAVTTLDLDGFHRHNIEPSQLITFLEALPCLVNLSLAQLHIQHPRDPSAVTKQIELPQLRSLRLFGPCTSPSFFLSLLLLPVLDSLHLFSLEGFDAPKMPQVTNLSLEFCELDVTDFKNLIRACPSVANLDTDLTSPVICDLLTITETTGDDVAWPSLHTIAVRDMNAGDLPHFRHMVCTRLLESPAFKMVRVDRRTRTLLRNKMYLDWLKEHMCVENSDSPDAWPSKLGYSVASDAVF